MRSAKSSSSALSVSRSALVAGALLAVGVSASATTIGFESLATPGGAGSDLYLPDANGGSRVVSGVTFNASDVSADDWEIVGNTYSADGSGTPFAMPNGTYALAGNAYSGSDIFGNPYDGLTISTTLKLTQLQVAYDDLGGGANDADSLTITAFGSGGDLGAVTTALTSASLSTLDTSSFMSLSGITGYRFETTSADILDQAAGRAYVIADDLTFAGASVVPEPSAWAMLGLGLTVVGLRRRARAR